MMQVTDMPTGMLLAMGLVMILVVIFLILGIAACIKHLSSQMREIVTEGRSRAIIRSLEEMNSAGNDVRRSLL
jgi:uncharacterized membrane protein